MALTPTPALRLALALSSQGDGGPGSFSQAGTKMGVTLAGQKPLDLNFWQSRWPDFTQLAATSKPLETTRESSKGGGRDEVTIVPPMRYFIASSSSRKDGLEPSI